MSDRRITIRPPGMRTPPPNTIQFDDFDLLCESMRSWDLDLMQLDRGEFSGQLTQHVGPELHFTRARFERVLEQRGSPLPGTSTVAVPLSGCRPFSWHGTEVHVGDLVLLPNGWELDALSFGDFHIATISLKLAEFERRGDLNGAQVAKLFSGGSVIRRSLAETSSLIRFIERTTRMLEHSSAAVRARGEGLIDDQLPAILLEHLCPARLRTLRERRSDRERALTNAVRFIRGHAQNAPSIEEVAYASGVSLRTLRRAFHDHFGVSPKSYLQATRLNLVHHQLRRTSTHKTRIAEIAGHFGFWHMGKFASDYQRHFGALPTQHRRVSR